MHKDRRKEIICSAAAILLLYGVFAFSGIGCPIKFVTGVSCAGCGMTRAWISVLHGDLRAAWNYHPLFWTIPPAAAVWFFRHHIDKKMLNISLFIFAAIFVSIYIYRLFDPADEIVVFAPWDGVMGRLLDSILHMRER